MSSTHQLIDQLKQELNWIDELNTILLEEKEILAKRQFDKLEDFANKKQSLSDKLEESAKLRASLTKQDGQNDPKSALQNFLKDCPQAEAIHIDKLNAKLIEKLTLCREYNSINGQVIATNLHSRKEVVETLTGSSQNNNNVDLYTATGNIKSSKNKGPSHKA